MLELDELLPGDVVQDPNLMENNHTRIASETLVCISKSMVLRKYRRKLHINLFPLKIIHFFSFSMLWESEQNKTMDCLWRPEVWFENHWLKRLN